MERAEIFTVVQDKVAGVLGVAPDKIAESTDLKLEYDVDSLELMEIGARLEHAVGIRLAVEDLMEMATVGSAVSVLHGRMSAA